MSCKVGRWTLFSLLDADFVDSVRFALVFGSAGNEAILVMDDDRVFGLGTNACSCLGTGSGHSSLRPVAIEALGGRNVVSAAFGAGPHVLAVTGDGQVFAWGHNAYGQLGVGHTNAGVLPTALVAGAGLSDAKVVRVACGAHHSAALTADGELYTWGHNGNGQLGLGQQAAGQHVHLPKRVVAGGLGEACISSVACGQNSTIALTNAGRVYTWGYNGNGQLGVGTLTDSHTPVPVLELVNVRIAAVAAGFAHTLAVSDDGALYAWGSNSCGQLGPGPGSRSNQPVPVRVAAQLGRVVTAAAVHACNMTAVQTSDDRVHMWGQLRGQSVCQPQATPFACVDDAFACFAAPAVSWRPIRFAKLSAGGGVQRHVCAAFDDPATADLRIKVDGKTIHAHRALLKIRCAHFRTMLKDEWLQAERKDVNEVEMSHYSYPVYRAFVRYLYTDRLDDVGAQQLEAHQCGRDELALGLLDLATAYCEPALRDRCCALIKRHLDVGNALLMYAAALRYDADDLREHCLDFCVQRMTTIAGSAECLTQLDAPALRAFLQDAARRGAFRH